MSWKCDHIIERFKGWWKIWNKSLGLFVEYLENDLSKGSIFGKQFSFLPKSTMLPGSLCSSLSAGWQVILVIWWRFNTCVCPPGRSISAKASGNGDLSDNLNAATPSCWKFDQDALTISSASEMYPTAAIGLFWVQDYSCVAHRFCLPCHISRKPWTLAILCNFLSSASLYICKLCSILVVSNAGSLHANIPLLARAICLTPTLSWKLSPVLLDCLSLKRSCQREKPASTLTPPGMIENISCTTLDRLAYFECMSSCPCHQSVISGIQTVLLISMRSEW